MLKPWPAYAQLKQPGRLDALAVEQLEACPEAWFNVGEPPRLVGLKQLHALRHQGRGLVLMPAYAQTQYIYDKHAIRAVDADTYQATAAVERVNQFDALGACYREELEDIFVDFRLGCIISDAAALASESLRVQTDRGEHSSAAIMVIDALRTVDAGYLLAAANPKAVADKLLAIPGTSAHNKGMAVDLTLVYWSTEQGCWMDADMLGHMDHPDMVTNHRNYQQLSHIQRTNRLELERIMLRAAWNNGTLIAPLREEFWDFRFPEDALDLWRVLESIARVINHQPSLQQCADAIDAIRHHLRAGERDVAYLKYDMGLEGFKEKISTLLADEATSSDLQELLGINEVSLKHMQPMYHGNVNVIYDADVPEGMRQANVRLSYLFEEVQRE